MQLCGSTKGDDPQVDLGGRAIQVRAGLKHRAEGGVEGPDLSVSVHAAAGVCEDDYGERARGGEGKALEAHRASCVRG